MEPIIIPLGKLKRASELKRTLRPLLAGLESFDPYTEDQLLELLIGALRGGEKCGRKSKEGYIITEKYVNNWFKTRVKPNTIKISHEDEEMYHLMTFALAAACQMYTGGTRMTVTEFSRRGKRRPLLQVVADIFTGKIGEVATQLLARDYGYGVQPDWDLSRDREQYRSDLTRIGRVTDGRIYNIPGTWTISVKSSASLTGAWAEAPKGTRVALFWKVALPEDFLFRFLHCISSWTKLIHSLNERVQKDSTFDRLLENMNKIEQNLIIYCYFAGFYYPSPRTLQCPGQKLPYLGEVREPKHMYPIGRLQWKPQDFQKLLDQIYCEASAGAGGPHGRT
jgi:hypothetical protein